MKIKNKEVILLSQYFYPDIASTGLLLTELCIGLVNNGFKVKVFTAKPNYDNKIKANSEENYKDISIKRLFCLRLNKNNKIFNILNSISYFISVLFYIIFKEEKGIFLIVSNPPFLAIAGLFVKYFKGNDFIYLIHDLFPEAGINLGMLKKGSLITKLWDLFNKYTFRLSKKVVVLSESMKKVVDNKIAGFKYNNDNIFSLVDKVEVIHNWASDDFCIDIKREDNPFYNKFNIENKFVVLYSGNLSILYKLDIILDAARKMIDSNIIFIFIGDGSHKNELIELKNRYSLTNVYFFPYQKFSDVKYTLNSADVLILTTKEDFEGVSVPSKLYTYLASGKTIISFTKKNSDIYNIINDAKCGFCFNYNDINGFVNKLNYLEKTPELVIESSKNARNYFDNNFSFGIALKKYIHILSSV